MKYHFVTNVMIDGPVPQDFEFLLEAVQVKAPDSLRLVATLAPCVLTVNGWTLKLGEVTVYSPEAWADTFPADNGDGDGDGGGEGGAA